MKDNKKKKFSKIVNALKMYDTGKKPGPIETVKADENTIKPTLYLENEQLPDLKGKEVGDKITLIAEGKITSHSMNDDTDKKRETYNIKIDKIGLNKITKALLSSKEGKE